jgi:hypothetical protein
MYEELVAEVVAAHADFEGTLLSKQAGNKTKTRGWLHPQTKEDREE